jgi:hypothetical protein
MLFSFKRPGLLAALLAFAAIGGGAARGQSPVSETQLELFLGLATGSGLGTGALSGLGNGPVTDGSAMMQTITVGPGGGVLSFSYDFLTNAPSPASNPLGALDPFAFNSQPVLTDIADNFSTLIAAPAQTGFLYQTGFQTYSVSLAQGTYNWGVGVVNVTTDQFSSGLLLDDFSVTSGSIINGSFGTGDFTGWSTIGNTSVVSSSFGISPSSGNFEAFLSTQSVPEPSSLVLLVLGGLGAVLVGRRHQRRASLTNG